MTFAEVEELVAGYRTPRTGTALGGVTTVPTSRRKHGWMPAGAWSR
jgi:hypothetical protein